MADPNNCDREWEVCLALGRAKSTAPGSSPTNSARSPAPAAATTRAFVNPRVPRDTGLAAIPTAPSAGCAVLSTTGNLSPGARRIQDSLVGGSSTPTPSSAVLIGGISERATATPCSTSASANSTTTPAAAAPCILKSATNPVASAPCNITRDELTPGARRIYEYLVGNSAEPVSVVPEASTRLADPTTLNLAPTTVDIHASDLATPAPTTCSSECPSSSTTAGDVSEPVAAISTQLVVAPSPSATPTSSTTTYDEGCRFEPEPMAKISNPASALGLLKGVIGKSSSTLILISGIASTDLSYDTSQEVVQFTSSNGAAPTLKLVRAQPPGMHDVFSVLMKSSSSLIFVEVCPSSAENMQHSVELEQKWIMSFVEQLASATFPSMSHIIHNHFPCGLMKFGVLSLYTRIKIPSWPPPWFVFFQDIIRCKDMVQVLLLDCQACRIFNLHTMDVMQISGSWHFISTGEIGWDATPAVIILALAVKCVQLQPTFAFFDYLQHGRRTIECLEVHNLLYRLTGHFLAYLFVTEQWLLPWEPGNDSLDHDLMKNLTSTSITCELRYSIYVVESLLAACYLVWWMRCLQLQLDTDIPIKCVIFLEEIMSYTMSISVGTSGQQSISIQLLHEEDQECMILMQPKPPWLLLASTIYASGFRSYLRTYMHITVISLEFNQCGAAATYGSRTYGCLFGEKLMGYNFIWLMGLYTGNDKYITQGAACFCFPPSLTSALLNMHPVGDPCKVHDALLFSWNITYTIASVPASKHISSSERYPHGMVQCLEFYCQAGSEYFGSLCAVTKERVVNLLARYHREGFLVVLCITNNALILIIGCKSRSIRCSNWMKGIVPNQWDPGDDLAQHLLSVSRS